MIEGIRRIFYDNLTGDKILEVGRGEGTTPVSVERDIEIDTRLSGRNRNTFGVLELPFGAYAQDFAESNGYRVNVTTKKLEFSYPDPNTPEVEQPYIKPLSEEVNEQMDYLVDVDFRLSMIELGL